MKLFKNQNEWTFVAVLLLIWVVHVLVLGWFQWLFRPKVWKGDARELETFLKQVDDILPARFNEVLPQLYTQKGNKIKVVIRTHPLWIDNRIYTFKSNNLTVRLNTYW